MSKGFYYAPPSPFPLSSHETALSIIPPQPQCVEINRLRILHDKAWGRWPPHINLIYPFVYPESLPEAKAKIEAKLESVNLPSNQVVLNRVGTFSHRTNHTIFLAEAGDQFDNASPLHIIRSVTLEALGHSASSCNFHLTVGQSVDKSESAKEFLIREADLLPQFEVPIFKLVVLIRERTLPDVRTLGVMRLYCTFDIPGNLEASQPAPMLEFWLPEHHPEETQLHSSPGNGSPRVGFHESSRGDWSDRTIRPGTVYQYSAQRNCWAPKREHMTPIPAGAPLRVSSYNVSTSAKSGSVTSRYSLLVQTILSQSASSDIVVLQEVSNTFLTHLLSEPQILRLYPFVSQGSQDAMEPDNFAIPQNVTLLSKYAFALEPTPVEHHGTVIASFYVRRDSSAPLERLIVAGIDLAYDASMAEKKTMLEMLVEFLSQNYPKDIWIIAGSFDIETSHVSISTEAKDSSIHNDTATTVASIDKILAKAGLVDAWLVSRLEAGDDNVSIIEEIHEGEDGATFDPIENPVAAAKFGKSVNRPQRYDKILLHHQNRLRATHFNQFGLPVIQEGGQVVPSSHYGIRSTLRILTESGDGDELAMLTKRTLHVRRVSTPLADSSVLKSTLRSHIMIPTPEERQLRKDAYALLRDVILGTSERKNPNLSYAPLEFVSLGSYALETWTSASDINCLCVGSISSETFFGLARQRIRRAESRGVRLLRTVEGSSRTSVDLFVNGFRADMQYCAAARVVER